MEYISISVNGLNIEYIISAVSDITVIFYQFYGVYITMGTLKIQYDLWCISVLDKFAPLVPAFSITNKQYGFISLMQIQKNIGFKKPHNLNRTGKAVSNRKNWLPVAHAQRDEEEKEKTRSWITFNFQEKHYRQKITLSSPTSNDWKML